MPGPIIIENHDRKPVTCENCGTVWWVDYQDAVTGMQAGSLWIKHRQAREGQTAFTPGSFKDEPYLSGLCANCDRGIVRPAIEVESMIIARRVNHFARLVDPENAASYAVEEYNEDFMRTFQPEFYSWWAFGGWAQTSSPLSEVDFDLLPPELLGEEIGYGDGSRMCPHVYDQPTWEVA